MVVVVVREDVVCAAAMPAVKASTAAHVTTIFSI
jgi:hypothetical protein